MIGRTRIETQMRALLSGHGCLDAAAEALNARWGGNVCKGTLSRRASGDLPWTIFDVIGLEDALGRYPLTRMMARRMIAAQAADPVAAAQACAKEAGEAVAAVTGAVLAPDDENTASAIKEIDEAIAALRAARATLEGHE